MEDFKKTAAKPFDCQKKKKKTRADAKKFANFQEG